MAFDLKEDQVLESAFNFILERMPRKVRDACFLARQYWGSWAAVAAHVRPANKPVLLQELVSGRELDAARELWDRMERSGRPPERALTLRLCHALLHNQRIPDAKAVWNRQAGVRRPRVHNGSFEEEPLNLAFGWRVAKHPDVAVERTPTESFDGRFRLHVRFLGTTNVHFHHVTQILPVDPGAAYRLRFARKSRGLTTDQGVSVEVFGYGCKGLYQASDPVLGIQPWTVETIEFQVPEGCEAAYALMGRRRIDAGIHLASLCRRHGVPPFYFEDRVRLLVHVLNLAPQPDDLYGILGLESDASQEEVKRAFRRLSRQWHPDVNPDRPEAAESFIKIHQAYQVLGDPELRRHYDRQSRVPAPEGPGRGGSAEAPNRRSRRWSRRFGYQMAALVALLLAVTLTGDFQGLLTRRYYAGKSTSRKPATEPQAAPAGVAEQAAPAPRKEDSPPAATPSPQGLSVLLHPLETASEDLGRDLNVRVPAHTRPAEADARPAEEPSPEEGSQPARIAKASFSEPAGRMPAVGGPPAPPDAAPPREPNREAEAAPGSAPAGPSHSRLKEPPKPEGPEKAEPPKRQTSPEPPLHQAKAEPPKHEAESPAPKPSFKSRGTVSPEAGPPASPKAAAGRSDTVPPPVLSLEATEAHISSFLDRYCRTFSGMDLEGFLNLFTPDARENGKPIGSLRSQYERNFARTEQLAYRIQLERWSYSKNTIRVTGRFDLVALFRDRSGVHSDGTVTLSLVPHREGFRVASLDYTFLHSEKLKRER